MRQKERIPIILEALKDNENKLKLLNYYFKANEGEQLTIDHPTQHFDKFIQEWVEKWDKFSAMYTNYPDLRVTQVLVNSDIIPNYPGSWYYNEDENSMIESGILNEEEIFFWGNNYDVDGNLLDKTKFILLKDLTDSHIQSILVHDEENGNYLSDVYASYFIKRTI